MAAWATSTTDLRDKLSDGDTDKLQAFKKVFGQLNGTNVIFKTFEFRRVTDFTTSTAPLGVYVNGALVSVASDDIATGYFTLSAAPADGDTVEATYYVQWFLDQQLNDFLRSGANWLGLGDDPTVIESGLRPACLAWASGDAYQKLAVMWSRNVSETYRAEDAPDPKLRSAIMGYQQMSQSFYKAAREFRDDFYTRQGQSLSPLFATVMGHVRDVPPRR